MGIQMKEVRYAKELDDAMALVVAIVKDAKAKKSAGDIVAGNVQNLINALAGIEQAPAEFSEHLEVALQTIGMRTGELAAALVAPVVQPVPAPAA